jgi:hypothetical protein
MDDHPTFNVPFFGTLFVLLEQHFTCILQAKLYSFNSKV